MNQSGAALLLQRSQLRLHFPFAAIALVMTLVMGVWYVTESARAGRWLGGGSTPGLACGTIAGLIIAFEMLLWPRKLLRRFRLFPAKYWLAAHLWIGLASLPLAILHSGFHLGGYLPSTFMILFVLTILSGVYGWAVQNILPRYLLRNLPAETIYNQISHVSELAAEDARQMLIASCGQRRTSHESLLLELEEMDMTMTRTIVIGAVRQAGKTSGRTLQTRKVSDRTDDRDVLWAAFDNIQEFLIHGSKVASPVTDRRQASVWFNRLRNDCSQQSEAIIDAFEQLCEQRRQFDTQAVVHRWLHGWLPIHIGLSVAVSVLLLVHIWTALKYW